MKQNSPPIMQIPLTAGAVLIALLPLAGFAQDVLPSPKADTVSGFELPPLQPSGASPQPGPTVPTVLVTGITFTGNTVISTQDLQAAAAPYLNRPASTDELETLRQTLVRIYTDRGYVNSGVIWNGRVDNGTAGFAVIEGRLSGMRVNGAPALDPRYITRRLEGDPAAPFNMDVLRERFQLLLTDPLIDRMNARVVPGEKPGEAWLDVDVALAPSRQFTVFANNYRPPSIGETTLGLNAGFRNLTGAGDVLEATLQVAPQSGILSRASLSWQLPLGYSGSRFALAIDQGDSAVVEQPAALLGITSQLRSVDMGLSHAVVDTLSHRFSLGLNRVVRENQTRLLGDAFSFNQNEPEGLAREALWRFWQDYSYRTPRQVVAFRSTFTVGQNNLRPVPGLPTSDSAASSFRLWMGQAQWSWQFAANGTQLVARATLQRSADRLLALDGLAVGGVNSVRGYRENELVRDQGEYLSLEFDFPLLRDAGNGAKVNLVPFVDAGSARNLGGPTGSLASVGLAARMLWRGFNVDLTLAKRLNAVDQSEGTATSLQGQGIHLQVSYKF